MQRKTSNEIFQSWKKQLYSPLESRLKISNEMITQLKFLHDFVTNHSIFGTKNIHMDEVDSFTENAKSFEIETSPINSLFCIFVDMISYNMKSYVEMMHTWSSCLSGVIRSVEDSDFQLSESWREIAGELSIAFQSMMAERTKQRILGEELQKKYESKKDVDRLRRDLILRERRYREQYKEVHNQVEVLRQGYEVEKEKLEQSMFYNIRDSQKLLTYELHQYCEMQEKFLEKVRNSSRQAKLQISKVMPIDKFIPLKSTQSLSFDPLIPEYDCNGEGNHIVETPKTPSKLNAFLHFIKLSSEADMSYTMNELKIPKKLSKFSDSDSSSDEELDEKFHGLKYFRDYQKTDECIWFESLIDTIVPENKRHLQENGDNLQDNDESHGDTKLMSSEPLNVLLEKSLAKLDTVDGRLAFAMAMNFKRRTCCVTSQGIDILKELVDKALQQSYEQEDPNVGRLIVNMIHTYYYEVEGDPLSPPLRVYLHSKLRRHPVWKEIRFWEASFYDALSAERIKQTQRKKWKRLGTKQKKELITLHENTVFGILGSFSYFMLTLGLKVDVVRAFVEKMCKINSLSEEYCSQIEESVEVTANAVRSTHISITMRRLTRVSSPVQLKEEGSSESERMEHSYQ